MTSSWTPERLAEAVRMHAARYWQDDGLRLREVEPRAGALWVTVQRRSAPEVYGMLFSLADLPAGPSTGEPVESPAQWAQEVEWVLDEELFASDPWFSRVVRDDGVIELRGH